MTVETSTTHGGREPLDSRVFRSAAIAVAIAWSMRLIGLISVLVLARVLTPGDFGIFALAMSVLSLVNIFSALGLRQALLRIPAPERGHYDTAWTIQLLVLVALAVVLVALGPLAAWFYDRPELTLIIAILASSFVIDGFANIGVVDFDRHLELGRDLRMRLCIRLSTFATTVSAALILRDYWALVIGAVVHSLIYAIATYLFHPFRPRFSLEKRRELLGVSWWMFLASAAHTIQKQFERILIGRITSMRVLGFYSVSKDLSSIFTEEIATALNRVTFVTTAQTGRPLSADPQRLAPMLGSYALIAAPLGLGLTATAEDAAAVLLGPQWAGAASLLAIIAPACAIYAVYNLIISTLQAAGNARKAALMALAGAGLMVATTATIALAGGGVYGLALTVLFVAGAVLASGIFVLSREAATNPLVLAIAVVRPFLAATLMWLVLLAFPPTGLSTFASLAVDVVIGAGLYVLFTCAIWIATGRHEGAERLIWNMIPDVLSRFTTGKPTAP